PVLFDLFAMFDILCWFVHFSFASNRLQVFTLTNERTSWNNAKDICNNKSESLVILYDEEDASFANNFVMNKIGTDRAWLGLHRNQNHTPTWSNGESLTFNKLTVNVSDGQQICIAIEDSQWKEFNCSDQKSFMCNHYSLIEHEPKNWCQAEHYCRQNNSNLVSISNQTQNDQVINEGKNKTFWIGLMHDEWEWENEACSTYRKWGYSNNVEKEYCAKQNQYLPPSLLKLGCSNDANVLCTVRIKVINQTLNWEQAFDHCKKYHTRLLQIKDELDQSAVRNWLQDTPNNNDTFWIGLRQSRVFGFWIWSDKPVTDSNWKNVNAPEMPLSHNCGVINMAENVTWSDENCLVKHPFLCEEEFFFMNKSKNN
uniref:C-type lectin domain-containing protein n=1 Tax=Monopterus albus TaxID=43700 RepID=A0A3Q3R008_MONAL